jgi:hypothetical protein
VEKLAVVGSFDSIAIVVWPGLRDVETIIGKPTTEKDTGS